MGILNVQRFFKFPAARDIDWRLCTGLVYDLKLVRVERQAELRRKICQIGTGPRIVIRVDDGYRFCAAAGIVAVLGLQPATTVTSEYRHAMDSGVS